MSEPEITLEDLQKVTKILLETCGPVDLSKVLMMSQKDADELGLTDEDLKRLGFEQAPE